MAKANMNEQHAEAAQLGVLFQQSQRQKHKIRAISMAAGTLQRASRCHRGRKVMKQRRFNRDSDNLIKRRVEAADTIKSAWRVGKSRQMHKNLQAAKTGARANRCARRIQSVTIVAALCCEY
jgi:hypothetical protein